MAKELISALRSAFAAHANAVRVNGLAHRIAGEFMAKAERGSTAQDQQPTLQALVDGIGRGGLDRSQQRNVDLIREQAGALGRITCLDERDRHSTVTLFARLRGLSTSVPRATAV